jgi:hypothetical protein
MAGIENLFVVDAKLPQVQTQKAPDDAGQWPEFLTTKLRELYPAVGPLPISVEFQKKDARSGTAIGVLNVVSEETGKSLFVPFIMNKFELCPLDVWMEKEKQLVHPLDNETFKEQFFSRSPADGLDARPADAAGQYFNDPSMWTTNYPPLQGRYSYASDGYALLDQISDTIRESDLEAFRAEIQKDPTLLLKFEKKGHKEIITKLAKLKGKPGKSYGAEHRDSKPNSNDFAESSVRLIPVSAISLKREGKDKYSLISSPDVQFDTLDAKYLTPHECREQLSKITANPGELMHEVDQSGERMLAMTEPEKGVFLYDYYWKDKPEDATEFADYWVRTSDGIGIEGKVFPHVVTLDGKKAPYKLFVSPNHSSMQTRIAGVKLVDGATKQSDLSSMYGRVRTGQTGTFVFIDDGKAIATEPVTIKAVEEYGPITAVRLSGEKIKISRGYPMAQPSLTGKVENANKNKAEKAKVLDVHAMLEQRPGEFVISQKMLWIPMDRFTNVTETPKEWLDKFAAEHITLEPFTIRYTGIVYEATEGQNKYAFDERRMKLLLATKGAPMDKIAQIMKAAKETGRAKVHGLRELRKKADIIKEANDAYAKLEGVCDALKCNLLKYAAEVDQKATVDGMLGLRFLNTENLSKFVAYRPAFEKVLDYLAELTLASRLGMKDVSDTATVIGIQKMKEVVEGLKRVETAMKKPNAKTAAEKKPAEAPKLIKKKSLSTSKLIAAIS